MLLENIPLGRTIEILVERDDYRYRLVSKVEDTNERRLCVTAIAASGRFFTFQPNDRIRLVYRGKDAMWEWDRVKAGLAKLNGTPVHCFQIVDKGNSFNRRNAYRVQLLEEIMLGYYQLPGHVGKYFDMPQPLSDLPELETEGEERLIVAPAPILVKGMVKDVSENGIGIYTDEEFNVGDGMFFEIPSDYGKLSVKASVVRQSQIKSEDSRFKFYYGCSLIKSSRKLLHYIYDLQRESLKIKKQKELGEADL